MGIDDLEQREFAEQIRPAMRVAALRVAILLDEFARAGVPDGLAQDLARIWYTSTNTFDRAVGLDQWRRAMRDQGDRP